jgi:hypothetical protein
LSLRTGSSNFKTPPDEGRHQLLGISPKVLPDQHHLEGAWKEQLLSAHLEKVETEIRDELSLQEMPENLMADIEEILKEDPRKSWDQAVREVAGKTLV